MTPDMQRLVELQKVHLELRRIRDEQKRIPEERRELEQNKEEAEEEFQEHVEALEHKRAARRQLEGELESQEAQVARYKDQLMTVKTNKEYTAMLHEIEAVKQKISKLETQVLESMDEIEDEKAKVAKAEQRKEASLERLDSRGAELEERAAALKKEEKELLDQESQIEKDIPSNLLDRFRRLAGVREGLALALAEDERCSACHQRLRPQSWHEVRHADKIVTCDGCGRILYAEPNGGGPSPS